jgi:hypothetical protein
MPRGSEKQGLPGKFCHDSNQKTANGLAQKVDQQFAPVQNREPERAG